MLQNSEKLLAKRHRKLTCVLAWASLESFEEARSQARNRAICLNGGDNSLVGGLLSAATLVGLNWLVSLATYRSKKLEGLVEGRPQILIHNGKLFEDVVAKARLTHHELHASLRLAGCSGIDEVHTAILENSGEISIVPRKTAAAAATHSSS